MAKNRRWVCPRCSSGALAPQQPRKDDVRRFCLSCSEETGRLVERKCPALERQRSRRKKKRMAKRAEIDAKRKVEEREKYRMKDGNFADDLTRDLRKLKAWRKQSEDAANAVKRIPAPVAMSSDEPYRVALRLLLGMTSAASQAERGHCSQDRWFGSLFLSAAKEVFPAIDVTEIWRESGSHPWVATCTHVERLYGNPIRAAVLRVREEGKR